jgi:hypothetical protein
MSAVLKLLTERRSRKTRPVHYEELLLEPVIDSPGASLTRFGSYVGWDKDHSVARRFYVAGIHWFLSETRINQITLYQYRGEAHKRILQATNWASMPDPSNHWNNALGKPQIAHACKNEPMPFAKAAQVLVACEVALEALFANPRDGQKIPGGFKSAQEIYGYMGIFPACWNIDDFGEAYVEEVRSHLIDPYLVLREATGLRSIDAFVDLTEGATVSRELATTIHRVATERFSASKLPLGPVRGKPGKFLGKGPATMKEQVETC